MRIGIRTGTDSPKAISWLTRPSLILVNLPPRRRRGARSATCALGEEGMGSGRRIVIAFGLVVCVVGLSPGALAFVDDLETDFWLPFTHFLLGDQASAGYASGIARSGARSFHVDIRGYTILDFGSAYGYAVYATAGAPITELRVSIMYDRLEDLSASPRDAYAAGIAIDLLDADYDRLDRIRYITAFQASRRIGLCGPTEADVVLPPPTALGAWTDLGRSPAVDFPAAPWQDAAFVRISIGFLCAAGLKGATYSLYFDDFSLDTAAGDTDEDGLGDLDEEARVYAMSVASGDEPVPIPSAGTATMDLGAPRLMGLVDWAGVGLEIVHPRPDDLSAELILADDDGPLRSQLLWDPGLKARGAAIFDPFPGAAVRGTVEVRGKAWRPDPIVHLHVDDTWVAEAVGNADGTFAVPWSSDTWAEGDHRLRVTVQATEGGEPVTRTAAEVAILLDRTPPILEMLRPSSGDDVRGLTVIEAGAHDVRGLAEVVFRVDGIPIETLREEPFTFFFETADLVPGRHTFGVQAVDRAGNEAMQDVDVRVKLSAEGVPHPCIPVCNLESTSTGDLPPLVGDPSARVIGLGSGGQLEVQEAFRAPWVPRVVRTETGVSLVLDATRDPSLSESDGLVGSTLKLTDFLNIGRWQIVVRDHGQGGAGVVEEARVLIAARTSPAIADTDGDGLLDGMERPLVGTVPVLPDVEADLLDDGMELAAREATFVIDGQPTTRTV